MRHIMGQIIFISMFVTVFGACASPTAQHMSRQSAAIADAKVQLQSVLNRFKTYQADFSQEVRNSEDSLVQQSTGTIKMARPEQLRWHVMTPDETILVANGSKIAYADMFLEQVSIYNQANLVDNHPMMLLSTNDPEVWAQFAVTFEDEPDIATRTFIVKNRDEGSANEAVTLIFINDQLKEVQVFDAQGNTNQFVFDNIKEDQPLPSDTFIFSTPEHFVIDDQSGI